MIIVFDFWIKPDYLRFAFVFINDSIVSWNEKLYIPSMPTISEVFMGITNSIQILVFGALFNEMY